MADKNNATAVGGPASIDGNSISPDELSIRQQKPRLTLPSGDAGSGSEFRIANDREVQYIDDEVSPGRVFSSDNYYSDDNGSSWTALPTAPPGSAKIVLAHNGYLFAAEGGPLTVYRSSYSSALNSLSWSTVLTGSTGSAILHHGNDYGTVAKDPGTGTMVVGEYGSGNSSHDPVIYRSTDDGGSWTQITTFTDSDINDVHAVAADPYISDQWIATLGDNGSKKVAVSTDGGQSWTREEHGLITDGESSQPVGVAFSPNYIFYADDSNGHPHGPWYYERSTGETGMVCATNPADAYQSYVRSPVALHIFYDEDTGVIYFGLRDQDQSSVHLALYARFIGDEPQMLANTKAYSPLIDRENHYLYNRDYRYPIFGGEQ